VLLNSTGARQLLQRDSGLFSDIEGLSEGNTIEIASVHTPQGILNIEILHEGPLSKATLCFNSKLIYAYHSATWRLPSVFGIIHCIWDAMRHPYVREGLFSAGMTGKLYVLILEWLRGLCKTEVF
jgi:hypothetical protein